MRTLLVALLTVAAAAGSVAPAAPAVAAGPDGRCQPGEFCSYYGAGQTGSVSDVSRSLPHYGSTRPECVQFRGAGAGQGRCVKDNALSVWNRTGRTVRVYDGTGYTGASQSVPPGARRDLSPALRRANASHRLLGTGRVAASALAFSVRGAGFVAAYEGFRATVYDDPGGNCTIGYGHLVHLGHCTSADAATWGTLTQARALALLQADAGTAASGIRSRLGSTPLHQYEFDALVSFVYNIGLGGFDRSSVLADLRQTPPGYAAVPADLQKWVYSGGQFLCGLYRRRVNEGALFTTGSYAISTPPCPSAAADPATASAAVGAGPYTPPALRPEVGPGARP